MKPAQFARMALAGLTFVSALAQAQSNATDVPWTDAEVRRIDLQAGKITLKHGEIRNLDMPPMTMTFRAQDTASLQALQPGDKVRFVADKLNGAYTVIRLEAAR